MEVAGLTRATPEREEGGLPSASCGSGQEGSTWRGTSSLLWEQLTQSRQGSPQHLGLTRPD